MNLPSLFISNSDNKSPATIGKMVGLAAWIVVALIVFDISINIAFPYPGVPKISPSRLQLYFDYGRSVEGKLARITRDDKSQTAPITLAGWYDDLQIVEPSAKPNTQIVTFFGMSHAGRLAQAVGRVSDQFIPRIVTAPGATGNWAFGAYLRDRGGGKSRAVVLALMSANLPMITTMSPMTWNSDFAMPYTADRFYLEQGQLRVVHPPYTSFEQYARTLRDEKQWAAACDVFAKNDSMYRSYIVRSSIFDHFSLFRLVRRAYAQRLARRARHAVLDSTGVNLESPEVKIAQSIVEQFALRARSDGIIPVIFIVNNFGDSDYLFQALKPTLLRDNIPYLSSHTIASPSDPRKYLPDSHFTDETDNEMAQALVKIIDNVGR